MLLILTATAGLCLWVAIWGLNIFGGFDAAVFSSTLVLIAIAVRQLLPHLPGRRD